MTQLQIINNFDEMTKLANAIAKSGLFGMTKAEEALSLMAIAHAEGYSPAVAARDYHIIKGRPTLKADAMLARFQQSGGKVKWNSYTDELVSGTFSHPQGGEITVDWDMARAKRAQLTGNPTWQKYPRNMLRSRVISEAVRAIFPGVGAVGIYTPEEVEDMEPPKPPKASRLEIETKSEPIIEEIISEEQLKDLEDRIQKKSLSEEQKIKVFDYLNIKVLKDLNQRQLKSFHKYLDRTNNIEEKETEENNG